jgi:hypothetical protein
MHFEPMLFKEHAFDYVQNCETYYVHTATNGRNNLERFLVLYLGSNYYKKSFNLFAPQQPRASVMQCSASLGVSGRPLLFETPLVSDIVFCQATSF